MWLKAPRAARKQIRVWPLSTARYAPACSADHGPCPLARMASPSRGTNPNSLYRDQRLYASYRCGRLNADQRNTLAPAAWPMGNHGNACDVTGAAPTASTVAAPGFPLRTRRTAPAPPPPGPWATTVMPGTSPARLPAHPPSRRQGAQYAPAGQHQHRHESGGEGLRERERLAVLVDAEEARLQQLDHRGQRRQFGDLLQRPGHSLQGKRHAAGE